MDVSANKDRLDAVFGADSSGETPEQRAATSKRMFVRSQIQVAFNNQRAKGRVLTASEALSIFGWEILSNLADYPAAPILSEEGEPARTLAKRRESLGLDVRTVSRATKVPEAEIAKAETGAQRAPIRVLEKIAQYLALDEASLGVRTGADGDFALAARLRELTHSGNGFDVVAFTQGMVVELSEAAWVIRKQHTIQSTICGDKAINPEKFGFRPSYNFSYPTWRVGLSLAQQARELLGITADEPIFGLKDTVEKKLGIPVVQVEMPDRFAGATVANGDVRGIAINLCGVNSNVWVRRNTLAHELGHLLWDPNERLNKVVVDEHDNVASDPYRQSSGRDPVEIRANAFAVEFLAPQKAVRAVFEKASSDDSGLENVMLTYGISYSAARWQIANSIGIHPDKIKLSRSFQAPRPTDEWQAGENFTADFFPLPIPISRRGRFAPLVIQAEEMGLISQDTAASFFQCDMETYVGKREAIKSLY